MLTGPSTGTARRSARRWFLPANANPVAKLSSSGGARLVPVRRCIGSFLQLFPASGVLELNEPKSSANATHGTHFGGIHDVHACLSGHGLLDGGPADGKRRACRGYCAGCVPAGLRALLAPAQQPD